MTTTTENQAPSKSVQEICIDLPGEVVQGWRSSDNIKVILRKHRDVIFDINQGDNKTYTVEATDSDFYNARDKKLIYAKRQGTVTFKDGERLPLRVSRGFKGALLLKSGGKLMMRIEPNELDKHQHGSNPKEKPAPIIIALGKGKGTQSNSPTTTPKDASQPSVNTKAINNIWTTPELPKPVTAQTNQSHDCPVVCVVDGNIEGMPKSLWEYLKKGGDGSGFSEIDPNHVATRNWIWGQAAGTTAFVKDNWEWLRASLDGQTREGFKLVKAKIHYVNGKVRFYFSGYSNANTIFGRGGFGPAHDRIMSIFAGVGKTASSFKAVATGIGATFKSNALVSFIFGTVTAVAEWKEDVKKDKYDLIAALFMATLKAIIVAALVVVVVALLVMIVMLAGAAAVSIILIGIITVGVGLAVNYGVEALDKSLGKHITGDEENRDGLASVIAPWLRETEKTIESSWKHLMEQFPKDYEPLVIAY